MVTLATHTAGLGESDQPSPSCDTWSSFFKVSVPWCQLLSSLQFWVLTVMHVGYNWGYYTLASELPIYMANVQHFSITAVSLLFVLHGLMQLLNGTLWLIDFGTG